MTATTLPDTETRSASSGRPSARALVGYALVFLVAAAGGARALDPVWNLAVDGFEALARAQYKMHLASQNLNADGEAELAVYLGDADPAVLANWVGGREGVNVRESDLPGWHVVSSAPDQAPSVADQLGAEPFVRAVLRNRGLWICH